MTDNFNTLLGEKEETGAVDTGFDWGGFAGETSDKPAATAFESKKLTDLYRIIGFIYPKKNYLSSSYDAKQGKELYTKVYQEAIGRGETTFNEVKLGEDGSIVETEKVHELKDSFSLRALMALDIDSYNAIKKGCYKVNLQVRKAEFLVLLNTEQLENKKNGAIPALSQTEEAVEDKVSASSEDKVFSIIKLKNLIELAFDTQTRRIRIAKYDATGTGSFEVLGALVPSATEVNRDGKYKVNFKAVYFDNENQKIQAIGDFDLPRVCNRSYEGQKPNDLETITNEEQVAKFDETIDPYNLALLKRTRKDELEPGQTLQQLEEIPYEAQADEWAKLGVTEKMLASIRRSGSNSKVYTNAKINELYESGFAIYNARKEEI